MRSSGRLLATTAVTLCLLPAGGIGARPDDPAPPAATADLVRTTVVLSRTYLIDRKYRSMLGPQSSQPVSLIDSETPELLWVVGFRAEMVGPDGLTPASQEFMCHSNLDLNMTLHRRLFGQDRESPNRVFTLSQGQQE